MIGNFRGYRDILCLWKFYEINIDCPRQLKNIVDSSYLSDFAVVVVVVAELHSWAITSNATMLNNTFILFSLIVMKMGENTSNIYDLNWNFTFIIRAKVLTAVMSPSFLFFLLLTPFLTFFDVVRWQQRTTFDWLADVEK